MNYQETAPIWNSGLGYLILLDQVIKLTNGYLINAEYSEYYRTLESWFITAKYWLNNSSKVQKYKVIVGGKEVLALDHLNTLRRAANENQVGVLKKYHELLDTLTSLAGLRLASTSRLPGVLQT